MPVIASFIILPVAIYLALAMLPRGRPALVGIASAAALSVLATVVLMAMDLSGFGMALGMIAVAATALAALVQVLRHVLGRGRPDWLYPLIVIAALAAGSWPMLQNLGV